MLRRDPKGYGGVGVIWSRTPMGFHLIVQLGRWKWSHAWRDKEMQELIDTERKRWIEKERSNA